MRGRLRHVYRVVEKVPRRTKGKLRRARRRFRRESHRARRSLAVYRRRWRRFVRRQRNYVRRRYVRPLRRDIQKARLAKYTGRRKALWSTPFRADVRAVLRWRGETPRIALRNYFNHPAFFTYRTNPPLPYAPSPLAELDHWIDMVPEQVVRRGKIASSRHARRLAARPHVLEIEHWSVLTGVHPRRWELSLSARGRAEHRIRQDECRAVMTLSRGLLEHFRQFLAPDVWPKLDYAFPAFPSQPEAQGRSDDTFTVLAVGNRFSDKGFPEALRAFDVLRERHGRGVRMVIVSSRVPEGLHLPDGVTVCNTRRMSPALKASIYGSADVVVVPSYSETVGNYPEAYAFGLPVVATRLHHGEDFVSDGESGFLIDSPLCVYTAEFGTRWESYKAFLADLERKREAGELSGVVDDLVDRLELMVSGAVDLDDLRRGARRLHAERFSIEVRNAKLRAIYNRALQR